MDSTYDIGKQYKVPIDNPFYNQPSVMNEIWAYGLRNPWRCSMDHLRPLYYFCGIAGQDQREWFDLIIKGGNYGWRKYEGSRLNIPSDPDINFIQPIIEYQHSQLGK